MYSTYLQYCTNSPDTTFLLTWGPNLNSISLSYNIAAIKYVRYNIDLDEVENAVREETEGPGQLLGYRAMQRKLREQHNLAVPRALVHNVMGMVDPEGLERR